MRVSEPAQSLLWEMLSLPIFFVRKRRDRKATEQGSEKEREGRKQESQRAKDERKQATVCSVRIKRTCLGMKR
jgi:hypothetical protein